MKVMLIGDSVRMFYFEEVKKQLGEGYELFAPTENCRFSSYVLNSLRFWLEQFPTPDVIHFNAGLWDTAVLYREDGCFTPLPVYVDYMKKILRVLKNTGAKVIFATTTPVSDAKCELQGPVPPAHRNDDIIKYNKAVLEAFRGEDVIINDLFSLIYKGRAGYLKDDMIHPNENGVKALASAVAASIRSCGAKESKQESRIEKAIKYEEKTIQ